MNLQEDKLEKGYSVYIFISIAIIALSIIYIYNINFIKGSSRYEAIGGKLDLRHWNGEKNIELNGQWEFYPKVLLNPKYEDFKNYKNIKKHIEVPGTWDSYLNDSKSSDGYGTYRLKIELPKDGIYGIKTRTIRRSSHVFANKGLVFSIGKPSENKLDAISDSRYKLGMIESDDNSLELVIQVSSYDYRVGGIIRPIKFGSYESMVVEDKIDQTKDSLVIMASAVLAIYFFLTFLQRREEEYLGYFSGTSFFMALYLSTMNEQVLRLIYDYNFQLRSRLQIFCVVMITVFFIRFTHSFYKEHINKRITNVISILMLTQLVFLFHDSKTRILFSERFMMISLLVGLLISYMYIVYILFKVMYYNVDSAGYIMIITISMVNYWTFIVLKMLYELDLGYLPILLITTIVAVIVMIMSDKLHGDYRRANSLLEKLISYDKMKNEFLAKASHELRTPLYVMLNLTESLIEGNKGSLNKRQQEDLFFINKEGKRLSRLVEDLLDASQFADRKEKLKIKKVDSHKIVKSLLVEMNLLIAEDKNLVLLNKIPQAFPLIKADEGKFVQTIYNLVHNSIKYTDSGEIVVSAYLKEGQAIFEIKDTGLGIKEEDLKKIFDTFYQGEEDKHSKGLGLGLTIANHLVAIQGGEMKVDSVLGQGSSFTFSLPIYENRGEDLIIDNEYDLDNEYSKESKLTIKNPFEIPKEVWNEGKYTVLLVEDEISNQKVILEILSQIGLNSIVVDNGKDALKAIEKNNIDLVILDFMLPDLNGDQVCRKIREKYSISELPILVLTASGREIDMINAFEYGANNFIKRPVDRKELISRIKSLLSMKSSIEEGINRELQYFSSQISPHFLYNTLNTIIGLSYKDDQLTRKALNNLAIYFRGKLDLYEGESLIPLEAELEMVIAYLEIEQLRFGEKLKIDYQIDEDIKTLIPPLTIQPLIENSIRHGLFKDKEEGRLRISIKKQREGYIEIVVEDNGIGMSKDEQEKLIGGKSNRIGFKNILEKIKVLKGASIDLKSQEGKGTKVNISIPEVKINEGNFGR